MRILLINPFYPISETPSPPLGLAYLAAALEAAGIEVRVLDLVVQPVLRGDAGGGARGVPPPDRRGDRGHDDRRPRRSPCSRTSSACGPGRSRSSAGRTSRSAPRRRSRPARRWTSWPSARGRTPWSTSAGPWRQAAGLGRGPRDRLSRRGRRAPHGAAAAHPRSRPAAPARPAPAPARPLPRPRDADQHDHLARVPPPLHLLRRPPDGGRPAAPAPPGARGGRARRARTAGVPPGQHRRRPVHRGRRAVRGRVRRDPAPRADRALDRLRARGHGRPRAAPPHEGGRLHGRELRRSSRAIPASSGPSARGSRSPRSRRPCACARTQA